MAVTDVQIQGLVLGIPSGFSYTQVIALAAALRAQYLSAEDLTTEQLDILELLLAAHFTVLAVENGGLVRKVMGDAAETYREIHGRIGGLLSTRWGSQAVALDPTGALATLSTGQQRAEFEVY